MPKCITIPALEVFDDRTMTFFQYKPVQLIIEHSLIAVSKWEMKWKKPFLVEEQRTHEEFLDYVRCMTINNVPPEAYSRIGNRELQEILDYIHDPMTATVFYSLKEERPSKKEVMTSERIYYQMAAAQIPWEAEKWHLNRLMTLLRICSIENSNEKMSKKDSARYRQQMNQARRAKHAKR